MSDQPTRPSKDDFANMGQSVDDIVEQLNVENAIADNLAIPWKSISTIPGMGLDSLTARDYMDAFIRGEMELYEGSDRYEACRAIERFTGLPLVLAPMAIIFDFDAIDQRMKQPENPCPPS